jgi:hypothetical protein
MVELHDPPPLDLILSTTEPKNAQRRDRPLMCRYNTPQVGLVINLSSAKTLALTFALSLLGRADEVIE